MRTKSICITTSAIVAFALLVASAGVLAETPDRAAPAAVTPADAEAAEAPAEPRIDAKTRELMRAACEFLAGKSSFSVHAESTLDEVFRRGRLIQHSRSIDYLLVRPDKLRAEMIGDRGRRNVYFDGQDVTITDVEAKVYGSFAAPGSIDEMLDESAARLGVNLPASDLAAAEPCASLQANVERGWYLGQHYYAGGPYHHLLLSAPAIDLQVWLPVEGEPLFSKLVFTYKNVAGMPQYALELSEWNFAPVVDAASFTFNPPAGARKIGFVEFAPPAEPQP